MLSSLFAYASEYRFDDFAELFSRAEKTLPPDDFREAYLMRAQIKLYSCDASLAEDLHRLHGIEEPPQLPPLDTVWRVDAPNRFVVFPNTPGALKRFFDVLPQAGDVFYRFFGEEGAAAVHQIQGEILYFTGDFQRALDLAPDTQTARPIATLMSLTLQYRCYVAMKRPREAECCMLNMVRLSRHFPECREAYRAFRGWAVITTSWGGTSPRFALDAAGTKRPVLNDRLENIRGGSAETRPLEAPFVRCAERSYDEAYQLRQVFMDVFHAIYWQSEGDLSQADSSVMRVYETAHRSGIIMPLVECGEQLGPLLRYICERGLGIPRDWTERLMSLSEHYEECLEAYSEAEL